MREADRESPPESVPPGNPVRHVQAARGTALTGTPGAAGPPGPPGRGRLGPPLPTAAGGPPGRRRLGLLLAIAAGVYAADVISKIIVVATLRRPVHVIDGVLTLVVLRNSGAAFSIGTSMTVVFTLIAVGVILFILRTSRRLRSLPW